MNIVFNELSAGYFADNKDQAKEWMNIFFNTRSELSKRTHKEIYIDSVLKLREILICENYTIGEWIVTLKDRDYLRQIVNSLSHNPLKLSYPYYYYLEKTCAGLGICAKESLLAISYPSSHWDSELSVVVEYFDENQNVVKDKSVVKNISNSDQIYIHFPQRVFEHHKDKHDLNRHNLNDGESTLFYDVTLELKEVQKLLDCAFGENDVAYERLYNYDSSKGLYIEFNCHLDNKYHGYHIENPGRVPNAVKKKIEYFQGNK